MKVRLNLDQSPEFNVYTQMQTLEKKFIDRVLKKAAGAGARKVVPLVKGIQREHQESGASYKATTYKVARVAGKSIYVGIVGSDSSLKLIHPAFGYRSRGAYRQTTPGTNMPSRVAHLQERGRKASFAKRSSVLAFVVSKLKTPAAARIAPGKAKLTASGRKPREYRVKGGFLVFAKSVRPAAGYQPISRFLPELEKYTIQALSEAARTELAKFGK